MTGRQERFCLEYIADGNGARAARDAGYSAKGAATRGYLLLRMPGVKARIDGLLAEIRDRKIADGVQVQVYLTDCIRGTFAGMADRERLKAAELLGRIHGLFNERSEPASGRPVLVIGRRPEDDGA